MSEPAKNDQEINVGEEGSEEKNQQNASNSKPEVTIPDENNISNQDTLGNTEMIKAPSNGNLENDSQTLPADSTKARKTTEISAKHEEQNQTSAGPALQSTNTSQTPAKRPKSLFVHAIETAADGIDKSGEYLKLEKVREILELTKGSYNDWDEVHKVYTRVDVRLEELRGVMQKGLSSLIKILGHLDFISESKKDGDIPQGVLFSRLQNSINDIDSALEGFRGMVEKIMNVYFINK